jgi:hypothetical protein
MGWGGAALGLAAAGAVVGNALAASSHGYGYGYRYPAYGYGYGTGAAATRAVDRRGESFGFMSRHCRALNSDRPFPQCES